MARQVRQRVTAIVLGGLIFGAPMLTNGTASAERISEKNRQVTFSGDGMFGLSCSSQPDVESMVVPAESTVRVVNRTGHAAQLQLGDDTKGTLPNEASTEVIFRRGTTSVLLKPNCAITDDPEPVLVTASPSAAASTLPDPMPAPSGSDPAPGTVAASDPVRPSAADSVQPAVPAERPSRVSAPVRRADVRRPGRAHNSAAVRAATTAAQAMPQGGSAPRPRIKDKIFTGTPGSAPAFAGMPPGDRKAIVPGAPQLDLPPVPMEAEPAAPTPPPTEIAAAEPVSALEPMSQGGPIGLLALIAAVCVLGVGAAAIRAFVSQRANGARIA